MNWIESLTMAIIILKFETCDSLFHHNFHFTFLIRWRINICHGKKVSVSHAKQYVRVCFRYIQSRIDVLYKRNSGSMLYFTLFVFLFRSCTHNFFFSTRFECHWAWSKQWSEHDMNEMIITFLTQIEKNVRRTAFSIF